MNRVLAGLKTAAERIAGTRAGEFMWRNFHWYDHDWAEDYLTDAGLNHPHRDFLIGRLSRWAPFDRVLEVGCASAPNLIRLSQRYPDAQLFGVDISGHAIETGRRRLAADGIRNVTLEVGRIDQLSRFDDASMDVVFTDAALIYVAPNAIDAVVSDLLRIARRAVVLHEYHANGEGVRRNSHWAHDWRRVFARCLPGQDVQLTKLPPELWPGSWAEFGYVIEASRDAH